MKKGTLLFLIWMLFNPVLLWADAGTKLARGLANTATGMFELVNEIGNEADRHGLWIGIPSGIFRGTVFGIGRTLAGVYEIVTFPFPNGSKGYEPIVYPESVFKRR
jgi:putative exosortase-associated protein (TIGR04073 family)